MGNFDRRPDRLDTLRRLNQENRTRSSSLNNLQGLIRAEVKRPLAVMYPISGGRCSGARSNSPIGADAGSAHIMFFTLSFFSLRARHKFLVLFIVQARQLLPASEPADVMFDFLPSIFRM